MAFVVLSECGLRPLPQAYARPRSGIIPRPSKLRFLQTDRPATDLDFPGFCFYHNGPFPREMKRRGFNASAPSTAVEIDWEEKGGTINGVNGDWGHFNDGEEKVNGVYSDGEDFNHGAPPPFCLADIRAAIPKHCWIKDPWKSLSYVVRDVAIVFGLAATASFLDNWLVWPLYWAAQGTMFWALFVLGHDCGHGSFSNNSTLNSAVGHLLHSSILVPYHGWRISHRTHHQNHGHVENDESWHPLSKKLFQSLDKVTKILRFTAPFPMFAFPVYLWVRSPGKTGSHFNPNSDLFMPCERKNVTTSTVCWTAMVALLVALNFALGPIQMIKLYGVPYLIFVMWLDSVTYLHHHDHEERLPWYRGVEWNYLRGGLTTLDRDYGWINNIHHDIGTHVIHHLFPQIPHYHLVEATEAAKPVLGKYYHEPKKSGPFPWYLLGYLIRSFQRDHYVSDEGDVVYYETEPELYK